MMQHAKDRRAAPQETTRARRLRYGGVTVWALAGLIAREARAQSCGHVCSVEKRDAHGCCPPTPPATKAKGQKSAGPKASAHRTQLEKAEAQCQMDEEFAESCVLAAFLYQELDITPAAKILPYAHMIELYERGCFGGDSSGCVRLADLYMMGPSCNLPTTVPNAWECRPVQPPRDLARAQKLYQLACDQDVAEACFTLAEHTNPKLFYDNQMFPTDATESRAFYRKAVQLYRRDCERQLPDACDSLADAYEAGNGVDADPDQATAFRKQACLMDAPFCRTLCEAGDMDACARLVKKHPK